MRQLSISPDFSELEVPMDIWSEPFWEFGSRGELRMPRCTHCSSFRWPAGPFCPSCHTQEVEWVSPGDARIYSYTILPVPGQQSEAAPETRVPVLVEFSAAPGVRLVSVLVEADIDQLAIGAPVTIDWKQAANTVVPVFRLCP